jgi:hypothetical protein
MALACQTRLLSGARWSTVTAGRQVCVLTVNTPSYPGSGEIQFQSGVSHVF